MGVAFIAAAGISAAGSEAKPARLTTGSVVTYTLSSDPSVRKVGTIEAVDTSSPSATWYTIVTKDMYCNKDRDVVRSDYIVAAGGSLATCGDASAGTAASDGRPSGDPEAKTPRRPALPKGLKTPW
jgi:hypothetical protein